MILAKDSTCFRLNSTLIHKNINVSFKNSNFLPSILPVTNRVFNQILGIKNWQHTQGTLYLIYNEYIECLTRYEHLQNITLSAHALFKN